MQDWQEDQMLFSAPLLPGPSSWIQRYYQLSRWLTPLLLLGCACLMMLSWHHIPPNWLAILFVGIPISSILFHLLLVRWIVYLSVDKRQTHKLSVGQETISIFHASGEIEQFPLLQLTQIRWVYSGYQRAFRREGKYFSGQNNQLSFQFRDRKLSFSFCLLSRHHLRDLQALLSRWYAEEIPFEEFNQTSGLPLQSHLLTS
ncbi:MAG: hypothetical protein AAF587_23760 [Bacteroidota bacterium]